MAKVEAIDGNGIAVEQDELPLDPRQDITTHPEVLHLLLAADLLAVEERERIKVAQPDYRPTECRRRSS